MLGSDKIFRRLVLIQFLVESLPIVVRDSGGFWLFLDRAIKLIKNEGVIATLNWMVARSAYCRRGDQNLYQKWIDRVEENSNRYSLKNVEEAAFHVLAFSEHWTESQISSFQSSLAVNGGCVSLTLIAGTDWSTGDDESNPTQQIYTKMALSVSTYRTVIEFENSLGEFKAKKHDWIVIPTPCEIDRGFFIEAKIAMAEGVDAWFCDHDFLISGKRTRPYFKPGWCPELLFDPNYVPFLVVTRQLLCRAMPSLTQSTYEGTLLIQEILRISENVRHCPKILGHLTASLPNWRSVYENYQADSADILDLTNDDSHYPEIYPRTDAPILVSIVIPTRNRIDLLRPCVESIAKYNYRFPYEIIILDNGSDDLETIDWLEAEEAASRIRRISCNYEFNWSRLNNDGVAVANGEVIILLNNDTVVLQPDWLDRISSLALVVETGTVGALLVYPDMTIQHAGVVLGFGGYADHIYVGEPTTERLREISVSPLVRREVAASTGACLGIRKSVYQKLGGMDEKLIVAGDVDLALRARKLGYRNIYDPAIKLIHNESKSRKKGLPKEDRVLLKKRLGQLTENNDPFYNANLSLQSRSPMPRLVSVCPEIRSNENDKETNT